VGISTHIRRFHFDPSKEFEISVHIYYKVCNITSPKLVDIWRQFRGTCRLYQQGIQDNYAHVVATNKRIAWTQRLTEIHTDLTLNNVVYTETCGV